MAKISQGGQCVNWFFLVLVNISVKDLVPDGLTDFAEALANPIKYQSEIEKRAQALSVFDVDEDDFAKVRQGVLKICWKPYFETYFQNYSKKNVLFVFF